MMKNMLIVLPTELPVPAIKGGAIETLITLLINENEKYRDFNFEILEQARTLDKMDLYSATNFILNNENLFDRIARLFYDNINRLLRILSNRRIEFRSWFIWKNRRMFSSDEYDAILVEGNYSQIQQIKKYSKVPVYLHLHTDILNSNTPLAFEICKSCDNIFVISEYLKKKICQIDTSIVDKTYVLKNCIDIGKFKEEKTNYLRETFDISEKEKVVIFCGRIHPGKGLRELLHAMEYVETNCALVVVGGSWFSSMKKTSFEKEIIQLSRNCKHKVYFTGYVENSELSTYYSASDLAVFPSVCEEAAGLVLLEAMSCGTPVISTYKGGIPEYVEDRYCKLVLVDGGFEKSLAQEIDLVLNDSQLLVDARADLPQAISEKYSDEIYYENFRRLIGDLS